MQRCRGIIRTQSKLAQQTARNQGVLIALRDIVARYQHFQPGEMHALYLPFLPLLRSNFFSCLSLHIPLQTVLILTFRRCQSSGILPLSSDRLEIKQVAF